MIVRVSVVDDTLAAATDELSDDVDDATGDLNTPEHTNYWYTVSSNKIETPIDFFQTNYHNKAAGFGDEWWQTKLIYFLGENLKT